MFCIQQFKQKPKPLTMEILTEDYLWENLNGIIPLEPQSRMEQQISYQADSYQSKTNQLDFKKKLHVEDIQITNELDEQFPVLPLSQDSSIQKTQETVEPRLERESHQTRTTFDPSALLSQLQEETYEYKKATNIAKFVHRVFSKEVAQRLPADKEYGVHMSFLEKYFEANQKKNRTAADMVFLFGSQPNNERNHRWANIRRKIMQEILVNSSRTDMVLRNNYINDSQKLHYLYSLRIYEWRLNDSRLVGNFN